MSTRAAPRAGPRVRQHLEQLAGPRPSRARAAPLPRLSDAGTAGLLPERATRTHLSLHDRPQAAARRVPDPEERGRVGRFTSRRSHASRSLTSRRCRTTRRRRSRTPSRVPQLRFDRARLRVRAVQHAQSASRPPSRTRDSRWRRTRRASAVSSAHSAKRSGAPSSRSHPQRLALAGLVVRDHRVGAFRSVAGGTVVCSSRIRHRARNPRSKSRTFARSAPRSRRWTGRRRHDEQVAGGPRPANCTSRNCAWFVSWYSSPARARSAGSSARPPPGGREQPHGLGDEVVEIQRARPAQRGW